MAVPADQREQSIGGASLFEGFARAETYEVIRHRLNELEQSAKRELRISGLTLFYPVMVREPAKHARADFAKTEKH